MLAEFASYKQIKRCEFRLSISNLDPTLVQETTARYSMVLMRLIFEWDENKARQNRRKHKVSFEEAKTVFNDPLLITFPDEYHSGAEERFISIGTSSRILLVVHTERWESGGTTVLRIISARKATASERKVYEEN